jgi:hypothetical protein
MIYFHILMEAGPAHAFAEGCMFDLIKGGNAFDLPIGNSYGVIKKFGIKAGYCKVSAFIYSGTQDSATIFFKVFRIISTPA